MIMKEAVHPILPSIWLFAALLLLVLPACENGDGVESSERREPSQPRLMQGRAEDGRAETTRLRLTYDELGEHYLQMLTRYEDMADQMSPEARLHYEEMRRHYQDLMRGGTAEQDGADEAMTDERMMDDGMMDDGMVEEGLAEEGVMARRVMTMRDRNGWTRRMLDMHEKMAQLHGGSDEEKLAEMHEQMATLYRMTLADTSAAQRR